jgi:hypothetical protein
MTHLIARFRANGTFIPLGTGKFISKGNLQLKLSKDKKVTLSLNMYAKKLLHI